MKNWIRRIADRPELLRAKARVVQVLADRRTVGGPKQAGQEMADRARVDRARVDPARVDPAAVAKACAFFATGRFHHRPHHARRDDKVIN